MSTSQQPPPPQRGMSAGRVILIVLGSLISLIGLGLALAGGGILVAREVLTDSEGFFTTSNQRFATSGRALASESLSVLEGVPVDLAEGNLATIRIRASRLDPERAVFVGIARASDVDRYLAGVAHDRVRKVEYDPFRIDYSRRPGTAVPAPPSTQTFWVAQAQGVGTQTVRWNVSGGTWSVVAMNADGSRGVTVDADVGAKVSHLVAIAVSLLVAGLLLLGAAVAMIVFGARRPRPRGPPPSSEQPHAMPGATPGPGASTGPVHLEGHLDADQSRGLWLVKWLLAIPHWIVLFFLWLALWVLTIIAFFGILFTGRYPRGIFDFNVGVMRWTWRVGFYSYSALGTDRYPPFTLEDVPDYPARFDIAYPDHLSRGLIFVKWLLAIPHLIIVAVFTGGWALGAPGPWGFADDSTWGWHGAPGLIGVLVVIAAIALLFTGRYPRGLFDLVVGLNRWVFRVAAYTGLMRDEYPPFRLDMGEDEPGDRPPTDHAGAPEGAADRPG